MALINVAKVKITCPICKKNDWCMVSDDGKLVLCQRIENDHPNKKGGWWHSLENNIRYDKHRFKTKKNQGIKAPDYVLNDIYTDLLSLLDLTDQHMKNLSDRGITEEESKYFGYKSLLVDGRYEITKKLRKTFGTSLLKMTPGFYTSKGQYGDILTITGGTGFMIPVKNVYKQICGIQIRVDQPTKDTKYIWLSSTDKKDGTNSGTPIHIAFPPMIKRNEIWITEGPLKANILAWRRKCIVIAAPGIAHWREIPCTIEKIRQFYHSISGPCIIAYDADYKEKEYVKEHALNLYHALSAKKCKSYFAVWDISQGKGIDEVIVNKQKVSIIEKLL